MQYGLGILAAFLLASCSDLKEYENGEYRFSSGKVDVNVSMALPLPKPVKASTRAINGYVADTDIGNVDVLVFDKDAKFMERIKVQSNQLTEKLTEKGNEISFTVKLNSTQEKRTIHLVANGRTTDGETDRLNFEVLSVGMPESAVFSSLKTVRIENANFYVPALTAGSPLPLVMWGRFVLNNGTAAEKAVSGVKLLRAAACIQVRIDDTPTPYNGLSDFSVDSIYIYHGAACGFLAPADYTGMAGDTPAAANPVPITGENDYSRVPATAVPYSVVTAISYWGDHKTIELESLYTYERNCTPEDYMAILIKAKYRKMKGWYKVVMVDEKGIPLNIIRNHRYIIKIVSVNDQGHPDMAGAMNSAPTNKLEVEITEDKTDFPCIATDGENILALSNNVFIARGKDIMDLSYSGAANIEACRIYNPSDKPIELCLLDHTPSGVWTFGDALTQNTIRTIPEGGGYYKLLVDFIGNAFVPVIYNANIIVRVDNLALPIRVDWLNHLGDAYAPPGFQTPTVTWTFDLIEPGDKNWNVRILDRSSTDGIGLTPFIGSPNIYPESGTVPEISGKYNSHAYLHVRRQAGNRGTIWKTSASDGKPTVTKIAIIQ